MNVLIKSVGVGLDFYAEIAKFCLTRPLIV
jgi:hypothetical protein